MKIAVHAKVLSEKQFSGIGHYTYNILLSLARIDKRNEYVLFSNEPFHFTIDGANFKEKVLNFPKFWSYFRLPFELLRDRFDLLFVPKEMLPPYAPKSIIVVYDLGMLAVGQISFDAKVHFYLAKYLHIKRADHIITISQSTKNDIIDICRINPDKISVIYPGCNLDLYKKIEDLELLEKVKKEYRINEAYLINPSSLSWYRKNLSRLIRAFALVRKKYSLPHKLVITGKKGEAYQELLNLAEYLQLKDEIIFTEYVPTEKIPLLLNGAEAMVFPSLHEGFGLPIIEAMACGCPVITSNCSSMPEVTGDAGILVNPYSEEEIAETIYKVISDSNLKEAMRKKGLERAKQFSWEKTAKKTLALFESMQ